MRVPADAIDVHIEGTPVVLVRIGTKDGGYQIPNAFRDSLLRGTVQVIDFLRRFDRINPP